MPLSTTVLFLEVGLAALLLLLVLIRPGITRSGEGKILAALALFIAPAVAAYGGVSAHVERTKSTGYCLSCHVMGDYGKSLRVDDSDFLAATHFQNNFVPRESACYSCHSDYGMSGDTRAKARGFKHVMKTYFGSVPDTIKIARRHRGRECLSCHLGSRLFEESPVHLDGTVPMADIKSGKTSCMTSGCHDVVHEVHELDQATLWDPSDLPDEESRAAWAHSSGGVPALGADTAGITPDGGSE